MTEGSDGSDDRAKLTAAISNAIAGLHREYFGRGASRTRTVMGADYVVCFMEDVYTPVEKTLIEAGRFPAVQETRSAFQDTMRDKFSSAVEELTGRTVVGFLSQVHVDPDLSVETFILQGVDGDAKGAVARRAFAKGSGTGECDPMRETLTTDGARVTARGTHAPRRAGPVRVP